MIHFLEVTPLKNDGISWRIMNILTPWPALVTWWRRTLFSETTVNLFQRCTWLIRGLWIILKEVYPWYHATECLYFFLPVWNWNWNLRWIKLKLDLLNCLSNFIIYPIFEDEIQGFLFDCTWGQRSLYVSKVGNEHVIHFWRGFKFGFIDRVRFLCIQPSWSLLACSSFDCSSSI